MEGLACVGKTTFLRQFATSYPEIIVVPEVVPACERLPINPSGHAGVISVGRYFGNDILKSHLALEHTATKPCALDRYYVSTLAHRCAELGLSGEELDRRIRNTLADLSIVLLQPNVWIYVTDSAPAAWRRYLNQRAPDLHSCWATEEGTKAIAEAQACCMKVLSETTTVIRVSSDALQDESVLCAAINKLGHLLWLDTN